MSSSVLLVLGAYLLGSVPFSFLVARLACGVDVRSVGSGNIGATNVLRAAGRGPAVLALALDIAKGALPVVVALRLGQSEWAVAAVVVAAVLGHVFPLFLGFRGGKGVATAAGGLGALAPLAAVLTAGVFLLAVLWRRYVSLASMAAAGAYPMILWLLARHGWVELSSAWPIAASMVVAGIVLLKHRQNLARILAGTESRLGASEGR